MAMANIDSYSYYALYFQGESDAPEGSVAGTLEVLKIFLPGKPLKGGFSDRTDFIEHGWIMMWQTLASYC